MKINKFYIFYVSFVLFRFIFLFSILINVDCELYIIFEKLYVFCFISFVRIDIKFVKLGFKLLY